MPTHRTSHTTKEETETPPVTTAAGEQQATPAETAEEQATVQPYVDPYKRVYHPNELPANPLAAAQFVAQNPDAVSEDVPMSEDRLAQSSANIAEAQIPGVPDPRMESVENQRRTAEGRDIYGNEVQPQVPEETDAETAAQVNAGVGPAEEKAKAEAEADEKARADKAKAEAETEKGKAEDARQS